MAKDSVDQLLRDGFCVIDFPCFDQVLYIMDAYRNFLDEPDTYKDTWTFDLQGRGDPDDGYVRREGGVYDKKAFLHYKPLLHQRLLPERSVDIEAHKGLLFMCRTLYYRAFQRVLDLARDLEERFSHPFVKMLTGEPVMQKHVLRLLYYDDTVPGGIVGKSHLDRSFLTLTIAESDPGLRFGEERILAPLPHNKAFIFPGKKAEAQTNGALSAMRHEITQEGSNSNRWSVVFFAHTDCHLL